MLMIPMPMPSNDTNTMLFARYLEKIKWVGVPPKTAVRLLNAEETSLNKVRKSLIIIASSSYGLVHFAETF